MKTYRKCPVCQIVYEAELNRLKHGRQITCSRFCSYRFRALQAKNKIEVFCATCGTKFYRSPSHIKGKHGSNFCSRTCHYKGRSIGKTLRVVKKPYNVTEKGRLGWLQGAKKCRETRIKRNNYRHTEATRSKLSEATSRAIAEGRFARRSKIEKKVESVLKRMGIKFVVQYPARNNRGQYIGVFDFFIPKYKLVIEVNGTFWHSDPRFFPNGPIHESQKRVFVCWSRKIDVISKYKWKLGVIWEYDIKKMGDNFIEKTISSFII